MIVSNKKAILYTFEATSLDDLVNTNKKHALRQFILNIILWVRQQEEEQSFNF